MRLLTFSISSSYRNQNIKSGALISFVCLFVFLYSCCFISFLSMQYWKIPRNSHHPSYKSLVHLKALYWCTAQNWLSGISYHCLPSPSFYSFGVHLKNIGIKEYILSNPSPFKNKHTHAHKMCFIFREAKLSAQCLGLIKLALRILQLIGIILYALRQRHEHKFYIWK